MQEPIIRIADLSHKYASQWAIRDINIEINRHGIFGLLGSNGAGKSTTMNILCGVLNQTEGSVLINGIDMRREPERAKKSIGFLPQHPPLYPDFTVDEYLAYTADLRRMAGKDVKPAMDEVKERCGIEHFGKRLIGNLSGGYRQRVGIAQAIIHKPNVVVMDEPTNGLDPNQILAVRSLIKDIAKDRVVIFSSHVLAEVRVLCEEIRMIEGGHIVFSDTIDAFDNYLAPHSILMNMENPPAEADLLSVEGAERIEFLTDHLVRLYFTGDQQISKRLIETSVHKGWGLQEISIDKSSLEEVFKQLSGKSSQ